MDFSKTDYLQISKYQAQELLRFMQNVQNKEEIKRKYLIHEAAFFEGYFEELLRKDMNRALNGSSGIERKS